VLASVSTFAGCISKFQGRPGLVYCTFGAITIGSLVAVVNRLQDMENISSTIARTSYKRGERVGEDNGYKSGRLVLQSNIEFSNDTGYSTGYIDGASDNPNLVQIKHDKRDAEIKAFKATSCLSLIGYDKQGMSVE
jgi:hypothetical protein